MNRFGPQRRHFIPLTIVSLVLFAFAPNARAARLVDGVLMVNGKPFYPLGSWMAGNTTLDDIERLGLNVAFKSAPGHERGIAEYRDWMRDANRRGLQVVPFLSYGGGSSSPWPTENVRRIAQVVSEPNLLAWNVGDDLGDEHLPGVRQTVTTLREQAPGVPTVADFLGHQTPEAKETYTRFLDIRCEYGYPIPVDPIAAYMKLFDDRRAFYGDPLWVWLQLFMWDQTALESGFGTDGGPGPVPDPSQVRLIVFAAINRGVRGFLFFPHQAIALQPELAGAVAQACREIRLFSEPLAGGTPTYNLPASDSTVNATAFTYDGSVVVSAIVLKLTYHRWVDEAVVRGVTIEVPWTGRAMPSANLVAMPDVVDCPVRPGARPGTVRVTVPSLELAEFVLVTTDPAKVAQLRRGVAEATAKLADFAPPASFVEARKVSDAAWGAGYCNQYSVDVGLKIHVANDSLFRAYRAGNYAEELRQWRSADRMGRAVLDSMMQFAESRRSLVPQEDQRFLTLPYSLYRLAGLRQAPDPDDPWHFIHRFLVTGPFPFEWDSENAPETPGPGFDRAYAPETSDDLTETFDTVGGPSGWMASSSDLTGRLDFVRSFRTTTNMVCYARAVVVAPRDTATTLSIGSNDGAKVWVNGEVVFSWSSAPDGGRMAAAHQNDVPVRLRAGRNVVLAKVENLGKNWQLFLSFNDPGRVLSYEPQ